MSPAEVTARAVRAVLERDAADDMELGEGLPGKVAQARDVTLARTESIRAWILRLHPSLQPLNLKP